MNIEPDTKDWTWVLARPCPECGLAAGQVAPTDVAGRVIADLPRWEDVLAGPEARDRPAPDTWSATEYACHVRDVFVLFGQRVRLMLDHDDPQFANWDQDETALADDYASQLPSDVGPQLVAAGHEIAAIFESVPDDAWDRVGRRSNGSRFTIETLAQYFLHDVVHHLHDTRG